MSHASFSAKCLATSSRRSLVPYCKLEELTHPRKACGRSRYHAHTSDAVSNRAMRVAIQVEPGPYLWRGYNACKACGHPNAPKIKPFQTVLRPGDTNRGSNRPQSSAAPQTVPNRFQILKIANRQIANLSVAGTGKQWKYVNLCKYVKNGGGCVYFF